MQSKTEGVADGGAWATVEGEGKVREGHVASSCLVRQGSESHSKTAFVHCQCIVRVFNVFASQSLSLLYPSPFLGTAPVSCLLLPHTMLLGSWGRKERPTFPGPGPPAVCRADRICGGGRQPM